MKPPTISYLSKIYFEVDAIAQLAELLVESRVCRPLVVTDKGIIAAGLLDRLGIGSPAVFDRVDPNPSESNVAEGVLCYREHDCDGVIAVGGGSPIDCAKCVALMASHAPPLSDYAFVRGGLARITDERPPLIAVPTTAGTGSEVGRAALITFDDGTKLGLLSGHLIPDAVICDPRLTTGLPPTLTAATGMDAISHCVETYCSPRFNPVADAIAIDGLRRAAANIRQAVTDGDNPDVRAEMMMAALQGGMTFQKGLGVIHSLSHPLGALEDKRLHHGTLNAIFLPHALRFNAESCPDRMDQIARAVGMTHRDELPDFFTALSTQLGLPAQLRQMGLDQDDLEPMAQRALDDHCSATNPRPVTIEACRELYQEAF